MTKHTTEETQVVKRTVCSCDLCGASAHRHCLMCKRDVCRKCSIEDPEDHSDYAGWYCNPCWEIGESYRQRISELQQQIDQLGEEWEQAAKAAAQSNK